jgi:hypothetical protein
VVERLGDPRLRAVRLDATDEAAVTAALTEHGAAEPGRTELLNATDPRFVMPLFRAALAGRATSWTWPCRCPFRTPRRRTSAPG